MSRELQKTYKGVVQLAEENLESHLQPFSENERDDALVMLGAINAGGRIARAISSQTMRALIKFQEDKKHETLGFSTFDGFLQNHPRSPMTKNQYFDRKKILEIEGDETFDFLTDIGLSISKRKLLGKGNIQLDGENIIILDKTTGEEFSINRQDSDRLLETITALADANADKTKKLDKGREDNDRLKRKLNAAEEALENERLSASAANHDEIENCYMVVGSTMKRLNSLLEDAALVRVAQFEDKSLRVLAAQYQRLNEIIAAKLPGAKPGAALTDSEEDRLASLLDDED